MVIFLGNIITGLFWHAYAARTRDARVLSHAMGGIILSDRLFTMPGVIAMLVSGVLLAIEGGYPLLGTGWILWPIAGKSNERAPWFLSPAARSIILPNDTLPKGTSAAGSAQNDATRVLRAR